jgi:hypothetical protein
MSTRLGVKRMGQVVSADERIAADDKLYYDVQVDTTSFSSSPTLGPCPQTCLISKACHGLAHLLNGCVSSSVIWGVYLVEIFPCFVIG